MIWKGVKKRTKHQMTNLDFWLYVVCYYHVTYEFQDDSTLYSLSKCQGMPCSRQVLYLKFKWQQQDSNPQTLNHLAKQASLAICLSVPLRTKWLWVRIPLLSLDFLFFKISFLLGISTDAMFLGISGSLISTSFFFCNRLLC